MNEERRWDVYRHTSPSGKMYFGITHNPKQRWREGGVGYRGSTRIWYAIQKYGWDNFEHTVIAHGLTLEEALDLEEEMISKYNTTNPDYGYNMMSGGQYPRHSPESIEKMRQVQKGHPVSEKVRNMLGESNSIPVICIETGEVFKSAAEAGRAFDVWPQTITKATIGKVDTCKGLHFAKLDDYKNNTIKKFEPHPHLYRRVRCITTGDEFLNVSDASRATGLSRRSISYACNGVHDTCGGMKWEFID